MDQVKHFIAGEYRESSLGRTFDNINPCNGEKIGVVHEGGEEEINAAVTAAREALNGEWARMPSQQRTDVLHAVADGTKRKIIE